ncbi:MAG TPA: M14 family zinc carboxypeptidase, partial [Thermomicrobiales bacterium]|nr:M14 family zinc carboxypeptidase [Thermomicrobiales bacterium]
MSLDVQSYMSAVPEMDRFLTVDELHADLDRIVATYPEIARLERVGSSTLGEPIRMLSIGSGSKNIFLFGCPHPNEPIGAMMLHHLSEKLCTDATLREAYDYTWNLIPTIDPDGTRLNEGWFAGPFTPTHYARNFYRPAGPQQVEWTFPNSYKLNYFDASLRETQTLMRVIDQLKPEFMFSLHNAGFGGVYYYLTREAPDLYPVFAELPTWEELPLRLGEPEMPYVTEYAPAIFHLITAENTYDYLEANGADMTNSHHGGSSAQYAEPYGTLGLVTEMAYFDDPRVNDLTVTETKRRDAILAGLDLSDEGTTVVSGHFDAVKGELRTKSTFEVAVGWFAESAKKSKGAQRHWAETDPETDRPATVAELFSSRQEVQFYRLLTLGMLVRMLEGEVAVGNGTPIIRKHLKEARST